MGQLIIGTLIGVVATIVVGAILYRLQRKEKEPAWFVDSHGLVGLVSELGGHLKMLYDETPVRQVTSTRILFWNAGRDSILKTDIAKAFSVQFPEGIEILECRVVKCSRPEIEFQTPITGRSVGLEFKFLGHGDGADLEVLHTGPPGVAPGMSGSLVSDARQAQKKAWPLQTAELSLATTSGPLLVAAWIAWAVWAGVAAWAAVAGVAVGAAWAMWGWAAFIVGPRLRRKKGYLAWLGKAKT